MQQYLDLVKRILDSGVSKGDRTGTGTYSIFSHKLEFDLTKGFPLPTTKFVPLRLIFEELAWFFSGDSNATALMEKNVHIWDEWALPDNVYRQDTMANYERLEWLRDNKPELVQAWEASGLARGNDYAGHKWLDEQGVPRTKAVLTHAKGEVNAPYGPAWRAWRGDHGQKHDQLAYALDLLRNRPDSRRILVSAWNPANMPDESISPQENVLDGKPALTPCHWSFEFYTEEMTRIERLQWSRDNDLVAHEAMFPKPKFEYKHGEQSIFDTYGWESMHWLMECDRMLDDLGVPRRWLDLKWHQRSCDVFLGIPFNIASYALLQSMIGQQVNMVPRYLEGDLTNCHLYKNHIEQAKLQLTRAPYPLPQLTYSRKPDTLEDYCWEDVSLTNYQHHPSIKGEISV